MRTGIWYGLAAYLWWGVSPIYWKFLDQLSPTTLIGYRVFWSVLVLGLLLIVRPHDRFKLGQLSARLITTYAVAAALLYTNWLTFVWAVTDGFILEASLGYFLSPLVTVGLGVVVLRERLRPGQWVAVALAATGVVYLTVSVGTLPWIALLLATTFGLYGLIKKQAPLGAMQGLTVETSLLCVPAAALLLLGPDIAPTAGPGTDPNQWLHQGMLAASGVITVGPLLLFGASVRRIPLSHMGIIQYLAPTLQFLLGVLVFGEAFDQSQLVGYGFVWVALLLFAAEGMYAHRTAARPVAGG
ncbi:MAG TPA: EamA family transporter RarD [Acidobacteria bacterium]|nr:EamA family transporter RarD [Acidobacteriota bacterium]